MDGSEAPAKGKKARKDDIRRRMLRSMPKGGTVVEIGVWRGEFSKTILKVLEPARLILVDPWHHNEDPDQTDALAARAGRDQMDAIYQSVVKRYRKEIESGQVEVIRAFSGDAIPTLADGSVDFAYIDGDHSYEGVRADLEAILPKLAERGVVACDDYHRRGWWKNGVIRAVNEFVGRHADCLRIQSLNGAQVALQKLPPME